MLIKLSSIIALITLAGCVDPAATPSPPGASPAADPAHDAVPAPPPTTRDAFCDHRLYQCRPNDGNAQSICDYACLLPSHCQDYSPGDYQFCATHPDSFDRRHRYCDPWGNPDWNTFCVGGPRP